MVALVIAMILCLVLGLAVVLAVAVPARREGRGVLTQHGEQVVAKVRERTGDLVTSAKDKVDAAKDAALERVDAAKDKAEEMRDRGEAAGRPAAEGTAASAPSSLADSERVSR